MKRLSLTTILIAMTLSAFVLAFAPSARAQGTVVSVLPATVDIAAVGQTQAVDINITDVTNMYAYEIKLWYLNAIVNTTVANVVRPTGHFLEPVEPTNTYVAKWFVNQTYNATHGLVWAALTLLAPEAARTGSGILFRVTFTGVAVGSTPVVLANYPGNNGPVKIANDSAAPILHTVSNGTINVIPEIMMLLPIFAIASLAAVALAKFRKKRQLV